jgi:hypothetical protein
MNAETNQPLTTEIDQPEVAFEIMARKLAGLTAAMEGFAVRQQQLHARDYGADLTKIHERWTEASAALAVMAERPAVALTPQLIASQIEIAGREGRADDHRAWSAANRDLGQAIQSVRDVVAASHTARTQKLWIAGAAATAIVLGYALGSTIPPMITQAVPASWYWPEAKAAAILQRDGWGAGERLLQVSDPPRWKYLTDASRLAQSNSEVLEKCRHRAARSGKPINCVISVGPTVVR